MFKHPLQDFKNEIERVDVLISGTDMDSEDAAAALVCDSGACQG